MENSDRFSEHVIVSIDVGGTNTDLILRKDREEYCFKLPSTKEDPSIATIEGVKGIAQLAGISVASIQRILHGTTVVTNAVIEHKLGKIGMITTEGFRDILAIGRHKKDYNFSIHQDILQQKYPLVERRYIKVVRERMIPPGVELTPLDEEGVLSATNELVQEGVESIAVCYLFSFLNPQHEDRTKQIINEAYPEIHVATSSGVAPVFREWYRFSTTAISCSLMKLFSTYVSKLQKRLTDAGGKANFLIAQSSGGMSAVSEAQAKPVNFLYSGPAGGVLEAKYVSDSLGEKNVIGCDIGGTSCDIVIMKSGRIPIRDPRDSKIGGYPVAVPTLDIETIGAGGGSIAWVDEVGGFNVGPMSAGADPGPACYGRGGQDPTVTDAQVILKRLDPHNFLGGSFKIDESLSKAVFENKLCRRLENEDFSDVYRAAMAVVQLVNNKMAQAIIDQTIRRGYDPRLFALFPFGGAGPMHACDLAEIIGVTKILVPRWPGIGSARGFMTTDIIYPHAQTVNILLEEADSAEIGGIINKLKMIGQEELINSNIPSDRMMFNIYLDCMYQGQGYELSIDFQGVKDGWQEDVHQTFINRHMEEYGHSKSDPLKIVNIKLDAIGVIDKPEAAEIEEGDREASHAIRNREMVYFGTPRSLEEVEVPRYVYEELKANNLITGPAIIDEMDTTVIVKKGWQALVTKNGYLLITITNS